MYAKETVAVINKRVFDKFNDLTKNTQDTSEGSLSHFMLTPPAYEIARCYTELDNVYINGHLSTAKGYFLDEKAYELGLQRRPAEKSKRLGLFFASNDVPMDIPLKSRFAINNNVFVATEKLDVGQYILEANDSGIIGNADFGLLVEIDPIKDLAKAVLSDILLYGKGVEEDEPFRKRLIDTLNYVPFGGNIADYRLKTIAIEGVENCKVIPVPRGGGTVDIYVAGNNYTEPSDNLIDDIQEIVNPLHSTQLGLGIAPIGHDTIIKKCILYPVDITADVEMYGGGLVETIYDETKLKIEQYLFSLNDSFERVLRSEVSMFRVQCGIGTNDGVKRITSTTLNNINEDLVLTYAQIPILGTLTLNQVY